jgi:hypothetical protein
MGEEPAEASWPTEAHIRFATEALARFSDWIRFADAKAGAVILVLGLALSDLLNRAGTFSAAGHSASKWGEVATIAFWIGGGLAVATTASVIATLFPKTTPGEESLAYFGDVAKAESAGEYRRILHALSEDQLADHVAAQAWDLSRLAKAKFVRIRYAYAFAFCFLVVWAVGRLTLAWSTP